MGHAAQVRFILNDEDPATTDDTSVLEETLADCLAGVSLATAVRDGYPIMEADAEQEVRDVMGRTGDYEQSHGTPDQRYAAYEKGFQNADIELCIGQR